MVFPLYLGIYGLIFCAKFRSAGQWLPIDMARNARRYGVRNARINVYIASATR
jgi:hypothetical protein